LVADAGFAGFVLAEFTGLWLLPLVMDSLLLLKTPVDDYAIQ